MEFIYSTGKARPGQANLGLITQSTGGTILIAGIYYLDPNAVHQPIIQAIQRMHWRVKQDHPGVIVASCGLSLFSWGEKITIQILPAGMYCEVRVVSELKAQLFDWGTNFRNERDFHQMLFNVLQGR